MSSCLCLVLLVSISFYLSEYSSFPSISLNTVSHLIFISLFIYIIIYSHPFTAATPITIDRSLDTLELDCVESRRSSMNNNINISGNEADTDRGGGGEGDVKQKRPSISLNDSGVQLVSLFSSSASGVNKSDGCTLESQSAVPMGNSSYGSDRGGGGGGGGVGSISHQDSGSNNSSSNSVLNVDNQEVPSSSSSSSFAYMSPSRKWMVSDAITVGHQSQYTQQSKSPPRSKEVRH